MVAEIYPKDTYKLKEILPVVLSEMCLNGFVLPHSFLNLTVYYHLRLGFFATLWPDLVESSVIIIPTGKKIRRELVLIFDLFGKLASLPWENIEISQSLFAIWAACLLQINFFGPKSFNPAVFTTHFAILAGLLLF